MTVTNYYVTSDAMGSVTAILDEDGNVLERRSYEAFGEMACMQPDGSPVEVSLTGVDVGFQGQIRGEESGLYQMGYRWYSPVIGRWLSQDPIGLRGGINFSQFVLNRPTQSSDVLGLVSVEYDFPSPIAPPIILSRTQPLTGVVNASSGTSYTDFSFDCKCHCIDRRKQRIVCSVSFKANVAISVVQSESLGVSLEYIYGHEQQHIRSEWYRWMKRLVQPLQEVKPEFYEDFKACEEAANSIRKLFSQVFESLVYVAKSPYAPDHKGQLDETPFSPVEGMGYPPLPGSPDLPR